MGDRTPGAWVRWKHVGDSWMATNWEQRRLKSQDRTGEIFVYLVNKCKQIIFFYFAWSCPDIGLCLGTNSSLGSWVCSFLHVKLRACVLSKFFTTNTLIGEKLFRNGTNILVCNRKVLRSILKYYYNINFPFNPTLVLVQPEAGWPLYNPFFPSILSHLAFLQPFLDLRKKVVLMGGGFVATSGVTRWSTASRSSRWRCWLPRGVQRPPLQLWHRHLLGRLPQHAVPSWDG